MYRRVTGIRVALWGEPVGLLATEFGSYCQFQYDPAFLRRGLEIAPFMMPLDARIYRASEFGLPRGTFMGLPGVFADSLPDSFGNALIDQWMSEHQVPRSAITALDRLAYVGNRALGALTYEPRRGPSLGTPTALDLRRLVEEARNCLNQKVIGLPGNEAFREIMRVGTSAGGAQAKAIVGWNRVTGQFLTGVDELPDGFEHWIVKFSPSGDPESGPREYAIYQQAVKAGICISESRLQEIDGESHFMTRRFDRQGTRRFHVQTLCALRHLPPGGPRRLSTYETLFETAIDLGLDYGTLEQIFRRMAFNVLVHEMDDHSKNFSFLMRDDGRWELAPAYDLTGFHFSVEDPQRFDCENRHALSVNGKFSAITDVDLLAVGVRYGLGTAKDILEEVKSAVSITA